MLDTHERLNLRKLSGGNFEIEVNWSEKPDIAECRVMRFIDGDKKFDILTDDLVTILLTIGTAKQQKDLLPVNIRKVRKIERLLRGSFKAKKNYTVGDTIYWEAPWIDEFPIDNQSFSGSLVKGNKQTLDLAKKFL